MLQKPRPRGTKEEKKSFVQRTPVVIIRSRRQTNQVEDHVAGSGQEKENRAFAFTVSDRKSSDDDKCEY